MLNAEGSVGVGGYRGVMGLFSSRNIRKAKDLLEKNRHKVGDIVDKAGDQLDKVSNGKTSSVTAKATEAARKYSDGAVDHYGREIPVDPAVAQGVPTAGATQEQANAANIAAANAITNAANAAANLMNNAAVQAQVAQAQQAAADGEKIQATHDPSVFTDGAGSQRDGGDTSAD